MDAALNVVAGPDAMDLVMEVTFDNLESLRAYHASDTHHAVRAIVDPLLGEGRSVDFVIPD